MSPTLHIGLLGDFSLVYGEEPVTSVNTPRLHSLLAYLVLHRGAPQLRQHLAFLFWPDASEAQARTNLRQMLHQLRHTLPDADRFLQADASTVGWRSDAPFELDVTRFEHALVLADAAVGEDGQRAGLERAARLYRADLLPSCYDDWIISERERLRLRHRQALAQLMDLQEARRDFAEALRVAQRLQRDDPLDEAAYRSLMRLLALRGDLTGALRAYHACATSSASSTSRRASRRAKRTRAFCAWARRTR
jgi:DNA-binding SARP family transcriptional activator